MKGSLRSLELDLDLRCAHCYAALHEVEQEDWTPEFVHAVIRAAYGTGYQAAFHDGGKLIEDHGFEIPDVGGKHV